jgi:hypothetical protein
VRRCVHTRSILCLRECSTVVLQVCVCVQHCTRAMGGQECTHLYILSCAQTHTSMCMSVYKTLACALLCIGACVHTIR